MSHSLQACEGAILVVDAAQGIEAQTLANVHLALAQGLMIIPVINKIDLPSAQPDVGHRGARERPGHPARGGAPRLGQGRHRASPEILEAIVARVPPPQGDPRRPAARASSSTSHYDPYKGVVSTSASPEGTLQTHARSG